MIDISGEVPQLHKSTNGKLPIIPDASAKMVTAFDFVTGNLVNRNYLPANNHSLQMSESSSLK